MAFGSRPDAPAATAVRMRAAVLGSSERPETVGPDNLSTMPSFSPDGKRDVHTLIVVLPPGLRAPALGRTVLTPSAPEWAEAGLGEQQLIETDLPNWAGLVLSKAGKERPFEQLQIPGPIDIPVWVDPTTGRAVALDVDTLLVEIAPKRDDAVRIWKDQDSFMRGPRFAISAPKRAVDAVRELRQTWFGAVGDMVADMKAEGRPLPGQRPTDESHPPIEGVGYRTWVTVRGGLVRDAVHPTHVDLYAAYRGAPEGRWSAVDAEWTQRAAADPVLKAWSDYDIRRLEPTGARW